MTAQDQLFVIFIGHGGGDGTDAKFNLVGPDLTIAEWNALLKPIAGPHRGRRHDQLELRRFCRGSPRPDRVVITATSSYAQRYHTVFPDALRPGAREPRPPTPTRTAASRCSKRSPTRRGSSSSTTSRPGRWPPRRRCSTTPATAWAGSPRRPAPDGTVAGLTYLDAVEVPKSSDPEVQKLLVRQQALTEQVDDLRRRRTTMAAGGVRRGVREADHRARRWSRATSAGRRADARQSAAPPRGIQPLAAAGTARRR